MTRRNLLALLSFLGFAPRMADAQGPSPAVPKVEPLRLSDADWKKKLSAEQYSVLRKEGTERPGTSPLNQEKRKGRFHCAGCDLPLFTSETKYESGTGWPSFSRPLSEAVGESVDRSLFMERTEVHCSRCGGHLGHVFPDGPAPTGLRYCMNGTAMTFEPK